ncbi:nuclear pore complex protein Nup214-like isoform X3 [Salvia hispanica]|uniref:nuclear pore complex protein Nup214-like isoform X3 n=1 Tax=Salvia hispanica TaxID=49212 RepID=UPI0020091327|nr:nuclear pore complex protein Nup214-like isoform X3 [Salvia hispanica]
MESNKDEAIRAKSIAESMIEQMDYLGAKKLALKAQSLYPELSGITQLLSTLDVYLSGEKIDGEVDWYRVLCVNPSDDHDTIKKQFRKLALKLHPDKNSSVGADGAFQLISEAWNLLSDEEKRVAYNQRRGYGGVQKTVLTHTGGPSAPSGAWNSAQTRPSQQDVPSASPRKSKKKVPGHTGGSSAAAHTAGPSSSTSTRQSRSKITKKARTQRSDAFWTVCRGCNVHFEYLKVYGNLTLLCRNCDKPFTALEIATPVFSKSAQPIPWVRREQACDPNGNAAAAAEAGQTGPSSFVYTNYQHGPFPETAYTGQNAFDLNRNAAAAQNPGAGQAGPSSFAYSNYQHGPAPEMAYTGQNAFDLNRNPAAAQNPGAGQTAPSSFEYTDYQQGFQPFTGPSSNSFVYTNYQPGPEADPRWGMGGPWG